MSIDKEEQLSRDLESAREKVKDLAKELDKQIASKSPIGIVGRIIIMGNLISGAVGLIIIMSVVLLALFRLEVPKVLENWGGIVIGFYFGTFMGLVKDYMGRTKEWKS